MDENGQPLTGLAIGVPASGNSAPHAASGSAALARDDAARGVLRLAPSNGLSAVAPQTVPPALAQAQPETVYIARSRYGEDQKFSVPGLIGACIFVTGMMALFLPQGIMAHQKQREVLAVVDMLSPAPPPPPPAPPSPPQATTPDSVTPPVVVAPPPLIQINAEPAPVATTPVPPPPQPAVAAVVPAAAPSAAPAAPAPAAPAVESRGDLASTMIAAEPPRYPTESRRRREEGVVVLQVTVGTDGSVSDIALARSSGHDRLDKAALNAVKRWRWSPTRRNGHEVIVRGLVEIPFELQGK